MIFFSIPFFKNTVFLEDTLKSLLSQSSPNWKAAVLDDSIDSGESEKAKALVEKLADPRIQYLKNPANLGMAKNWNQGLELGKRSPDAIATTILHADDRLLPDYVSSMANAIKENPDTSAFFCKAAVIDENGKRAFSFTDFYKDFLLPPNTNGIITLSGVDGVSPLIPGNFIFCPTLCYRNSKINRLFDPHLKMVTDFEFTLDLLMNGHTLQGLYSTTLFEYRRHGSNTTNLMNQNLQRFKEEKELYLGLANQLEKKGFPQLARQARALGIIKKNLLFQIVTSMLRFNFVLMSRYIRFLFSLKT